MPDDMPPALLVERFDIRDRANDPRMIAMEDMCSVLDLTPDEKYTGTIERVARALRALSTDPDADLLILLKRVLFAWLIADGDMHLKNMALLKTAQQGDAVFEAVRFAPVYDALTTRVFPGLEHDRMALKLGGRDERLRRADFVAVATLAGLRAGDANAAMDDLLGRLTGAIDGITIPPTCIRDAASGAVVGKTLDLCRERVASFG
jgi:serine/threonine-protein kinase HipA